MLEIDKIERKFTMECLPNELLMQILGYLTTFDLLQFCKAYEHLDYFLKEKDLIWHSNLSKRFELHDFNITKFICTKMNPSFIRVLNINYLYWIPVHDLRELISKLDNLEELQAIDTKLGFSQSDILGYLRLKKLAISMGGDDNYYEPDENTNTIISEPLIELKYLYLKLYLANSVHPKISELVSELATIFICNLSQLEELWIEDYFKSPYNIRYQKFLQLDDLKRMVIRSNEVSMFLKSDYTSWGFSKVFENSSNNYLVPSDMILESVTNRSMSLKGSIREPKSTALEKAWNIFDRHCGLLPYGPKEFKLLSMNEDLLNINFEELDFCVSISLCDSKYSKRYSDAALEILRSPNSKGLKSLQFKSCLLQRNPDDGLSKVLLKKPRYWVLSGPAELHPFYKIAKNINNLVELDISSCSECTGIDKIPAYKLIGIFEKLKRLSLQIPLLLDGSFFKEIFTKCKFLESLNLQCTTTNEKFMVNLCQNMKFSTALRDFRLECEEINIEKLLASFSEISNKKLLRVVLNCDALSFYHTEPFSDFFEKNRQLILFYLVASKATKKHMFNIRKTIHKFKGVNRGKVFYAKTEQTTHIPSAHYDMLFCRNRITYINFDEF